MRQLERVGTCLGVFFPFSLKPGTNVPNFNEVCILSLKQPFYAGPQLLDVFHHLLALSLHSKFGEQWRHRVSAYRKSNCQGQEVIKW
jgi:hypothetical protein